MFSKKVVSILTAISIFTACFAGAVSEDVLSLTQISPEDVSAAVLEDTSEEPVEEVAASNEVEATQEDGKITVEVLTKELKKHENKDGEAGYWTGFAVAAPEGAEQMKAAFGETPELTLGELTALEEAVAGEVDGAAFYANAGVASPKLYAALQWFDENGEAVSAVTEFVMDLSGVTLAIDYSPEVVAAKIVDKDSEERVLYDTYTIASENVDGVISVDVAMTELAEHTNGNDEEGYWTGFAVAAPEGAMYAKYTFNGVTDGYIPVEKEIAATDGISKDGIAFYTDAANPETAAKLQWFDENGVALSNEIEFEIDLSAVKLNWIKSEAVSAAVLADISEEPVEDVAASNEVEATQEDGKITVEVLTKELKKHENKDGEAGYWTGFAVAAPEGAEQMKAAFGETPELTLGELTALEANIAGEADGAAFYANAGAASPKLYAALQWFDENGEALSAVTEFVMDLSEVTLAIDYSPEVVAAKIVDQSESDAQPYSSYSVSSEEKEDGLISVGIEMSDLKAHENTLGTSGHWTGFAVTAPAGATQMKVAFDTADNIDWSTATLCPVELDVSEENDGVAFYINADEAVPKTAAKLQWFDENGIALSDVIIFEINLDGVSLYSEPVYGGSSGGSGGGSAWYYTVRFETNGGSTVASIDVSKNKAFFAPTEPVKAGYSFEGWYTDKNLTDKYNFSQAVTKSFTLYAKWTAIEKDDTDDGISFTDVSSAAWYYDVVKAAVEKGLMNGVSSTEFAPDAFLTRGMFVTVLYRAEGEPYVSGVSGFNDVANDRYYTNAVIWAKENGIINGVSNYEFAPDESITREQMAAVIYRYVKSKGVEALASENILYSDSDSISQYAIDAVTAVSDMGIIKGNADGSFAPARRTTRAEAAAVLVRLLEIMTTDI